MHVPAHGLQCSTSLVSGPLERSITLASPTHPRLNGNGLVGAVHKRIIRVLSKQSSGVCHSARVCVSECRTGICPAWNNDLMWSMAIPCGGVLWGSV